MVRHDPMAEPRVLPRVDIMALTAKRVQRLLTKGEPGRHFDGAGLYLVVVSRTAANWERRYELNGKPHWMGLGSARAFTLAEARGRNRRASQLLADGIDPLAEKRARKAALLAAAATRLTFREATERFVAQRDAAWTNAKHAREYRATLERYAWLYLGGLDVAAIDVPHVLAVLEQKVPAERGHPAGAFWEARTVTADRTRNRIESVLSWCAARGYRPKGPNPASWSGNLEHVLPAPSKVARVSRHSAVPHGEIPALMAELAKREGVGVKALQFLILTAARSNEVLGATWDEINFADAVWTVPATRMKSRREHRVPLAPQAMALLQGLYTESGNPHLFIGARRAVLGDAAMAATLRRLGRSETIHGFRSAFSTWAHERTAHSNHTIELCLAHAIGTEVEKAYRRTDLFQKRRAIMEAWARHCCSPPAAGAVLPLRKAGPSA
jgi:integrase